MSDLAPIENVLPRLAAVRSNGPHSWMARCPAHDDRNPSLSVGIGREGQVIFNCFADTGCTTESIVSALDLTMSDLFPASPLSKSAHENERRGTRATSSDSQSGPRNPDTGTVHKPSGANPWITHEQVAWYDYRDEQGTLLYQNVRFQPKTFRPRKPDPNAPGCWILKLRNVRKVLYRLREVLSAIEDGRTVYLVEGEKDADNLTALGFCATTNQGGAKEWQPSYVESLAGAHLVILPDNDSAGWSRIDRIASELSSGVKSLRVLHLPDLPKKGDVSDWIDAGGTAEELEELTRRCAPWQPGQAEYSESDSGESAPKKRAITSFSDADLMEMVLPPPRWAVPGLIPEGLTLFVGRPKLGKSWIMLDLAIAVSQGGKAFGSVRVTAGQVLALMLEERAGRLQTRYMEMNGDAPPTGRLRFELEFPRFGEESERTLEAAMESLPDLRLVIVDTLAKIRREPDARRNGNIYREDYQAIDEMKRLSDQFRIPFVVVHHLKKSESEDPMDAVSGSAGLTGAADGVILFDRKRQEKTGRLTIMSRDIDEKEVEIGWDDDRMRWTLFDETIGEITPERRVILDQLAIAGMPMSSKTLATLTGRNYEATKKLLNRMKSDGLVVYQNRSWVPAEAFDAPLRLEVI